MNSANPPRFHFSKPPNNNSNSSKDKFTFGTPLFTLGKSDDDMPTSATSTIATKCGEMSLNTAFHFGTPSPNQTEVFTFKATGKLNNPFSYKSDNPKTIARPMRRFATQGKTDSTLSDLASRLQKKPDLESKLKSAEEIQDKIREAKEKWAKKCEAYAKTVERFQKTHKEAEKKHFDFMLTIMQDKDFLSPGQIQQLKNELQQLEKVKEAATSLDEKIELLECPVCLESATEIIYDCENCYGILCGNCFQQKLSFCPSCREDLQEKPLRRNRNAEKLVAKMKK